MVLALAREAASRVAEARETASWGERPQRQEVMRILQSRSTELSERGRGEKQAQEERKQ
jgi:hypothetical protein